MSPPPVSLERCLANMTARNECGWFQRDRRWHCRVALCTGGHRGDRKWLAPAATSRPACPALEVAHHDCSLLSVTASPTSMLGWKPQPRLNCEVHPESLPEAFPCPAVVAPKHLTLNMTKPACTEAWSPTRRLRPDIPSADHDYSREAIREWASCIWCGAARNAGN